MHIRVGKCKSLQANCLIGVGGVTYQYDADEARQRGDGAPTGDLKESDVESQHCSLQYTAPCHKGASYEIKQYIKISASFSDFCGKKNLNAESPARRSHNPSILSPRRNEEPQSQQDETGRRINALGWFELPFIGNPGAPKSLDYPVRPTPFPPLGKRCIGSMYEILGNVEILRLALSPSRWGRGIETESGKACSQFCHSGA